jgi:RNA polymerase sigma-70 factor, ECF subfamily
VLAGPYGILDTWEGPRSKSGAALRPMGPMTDSEGRSEISNGEICARIKAGSREAEAALVSRLQPGLRLVLQRATGRDLDLARELCQETLVVLLKRLRAVGLNDPSELAAFAAQTARNLAIAHHRKEGRRRTDANTEAIDTVSDPGRGQPEQVAANRLGAIVHRLLGELPTDRDRTVLSRYYLQEEPKADICRDLAMSDLAFNQVLFRARNRFRDLLSSAGIGKDDVFDSEHAS